jgi:aminoglycoside phosphotransferase (APT) family kinase protein
VAVSNEVLDDQLMAVLRSVTGSPDLAYSRTPVGLAGGFWAELFAFSLAGPPDGWPADLVVRIMPEPFTAVKETTMQRCVAGAGFPTPAVRAAGGPDDGLGRAFMIMDRAPGGPLLAGLSMSGVLRRGPALFDEIPKLLASTMARLHTLDPEPVREELDAVGGVMASVGSMLAAERERATEFSRPDLARAAQWLIDQPAPAAPDVICHGDLHPFNVLRDGDRITLLDWSTALLAPRSYDVAFTSLALSEAALGEPPSLRPAVRWMGRRMAARFVASYEKTTGAVIDPAELAWYQAVVCLRSLVEVSGWVQSGQLVAHRRHPWVVASPEFARRLTATTALPVRPLQPATRT